MQNGGEYEIIPVNLGMVNAFIIKGKKSSILVDCGVPGSDKKIMEAMKTHGIESLSLMVFTHGHEDHVGSASALRKATGVKSMIHILDADILRTGKNPPLNPTNARGRLLSKFMGEEIKGFLTYEPELVIDSEVSLEEYGIAGRVIMTPGHTTGSVSVVLDNGAAFVGDAIIGGMVGKGKPNGPMYADDITAANKSIQQIIAQSPVTVYSGHGGPFMADEINSAFR